MRVTITFSKVPNTFFAKTCLDRVGTDDMDGLLYTIYIQYYIYYVNYLYLARFFKVNCLLILAFIVLFAFLQEVKPLR